MKLRRRYKSFLIRCWTESGSDLKNLRFLVEEVGAQMESQGCGTPDALIQYLQTKVCQGKEAVEEDALL